MRKKARRDAGRPRAAGGTGAASALGEQDTVPNGMAQAKAKAKAKTKVDGWTALAGLLAEGDAALRARVELAANDSAGDVRDHARELLERGVTKPIPRLPLIALLDGLDAKERVALIDWKEPAEDVEHLLKQMKPRPPIEWKWTKAFDEDVLDDVSTERFLEAVAAHVEAKNVLLSSTRAPINSRSSSSPPIVRDGSSPR